MRNIFLQDNKLSIFMKKIFNMHVVFGYNHFRLKKVTPDQIGLEGEEYKNIHFEKLQKYFHLFWIPFIPLGKMWVMKKEDGNKYKCTVAAEQYLEQLDLGPMRTAIFAWSGFLLIITGFIGYLIYDKIDKIIYNKNLKEKTDQHITYLNNSIDSIKIGDYFLFSEKTPDYLFYNSLKNPAKVLKTEGNKVLLGCWSKKDDSDIYKVNDEYSLADLFYTYPIQDSFWIDKTLLKKAINTNPDEYGIEKSFVGISLEKFAINNMYMLKEVIRNLPPLPSIYTENNTNTDNYVEIINKGFDAQVDSVVGKDRNSNWQISKNHSFKHGDVFAIKTNATGNACIYFSVDGKQYTSNIDNSTAIKNWILYADENRNGIY